MDDPKSLASGVLLRLYDQQTEAKLDLTVEEMAKSFRPPISVVKLRTAVGLLCQAGLIRSRLLSGNSHYIITDRGIAAVEECFSIDDSGVQRTFTVSTNGFDVMAYMNIERRSVDWTRIGTILTGLSIIVAIFLAVLA